MIHSYLFTAEHAMHRLDIPCTVSGNYGLEDSGALHVLSTCLPVYLCTCLLLKEHYG